MSSPTITVISNNKGTRVTRKNWPDNVPWSLAMQPLFEWLPTCVLIHCDFEHGEVMEWQRAQHTDCVSADIDSHGVVTGIVRKTGYVFVGWRTLSDCDSINANGK